MLLISSSILYNRFINIWLFSVSIVIGVPTVKRDSVSYVAQTIESLIAGMTPEEQNDCLIVLFVAEVIAKIRDVLKAAFHVCHHCPRFLYNS